MKIEIPNISEQHIFIFKMAQDEAKVLIDKNSCAEIKYSKLSINESEYSNKHLLRKREGWEPPHKDIVAAYFEQFHDLFGIGSDNKLADLLDLSDGRRIRDFKQGKSTVPYDVWRKFLIMTGRATQDIIPVYGIVVNIF